MGALLILVAYGLAQVGVITDKSRLYLAFNLVGAAILGVLAIVGRQAGFILLESAWALISLWFLVKPAKHSLDHSAPSRDI